MKFKKILLFLIALFYTAHSRATPQIPDSLTYNDQVGVVDECPFEPIRVKKKLEFGSHQTAIRRGYICSWSIKNGTLYLTEISGDLIGSETKKKVDTEQLLPRVDLKQLFPKASGDIPADWYSGKLYVHSGKLKLQAAFGFVRAHEALTVFEIDKGKVVKKKKFLYPSNIDVMNKRAKEKYDLDVDLVRENTHVEVEETLEEIAAMLYQEKEYKKAIEVYTEAIESSPEDATLYLRRGLCYDGLESFDEALKDYTKGINKKASAGGSKNSLEWADLYYFRGDVYHRTGVYDKAIDDFEKSLAVKQDHPMSIMILPWILATCPVAELRDPAKAIKWATRKCEMKNWKNAGAIDTLAAAYAASKDFSKAIDMQKRALKLVKDEKAKNEFEQRLKLYEAGKPYYKKMKVEQKSPAEAGQ